jgi:glycosyltransferase involved in cell wall biosynthesis
MSDVLPAQNAPLAERRLFPLPTPGGQPHPGRRRLKLCFITETLHAGVGRHVAETIEELAGRGHEIHLLYSPLRSDRRFLRTLANLENVYCQQVTMHRALGLGDFASFREIRKYVRQHGPFDIIHGHSSKGGGYARLLKPFSRSALIYSPHAFVTRSPVLGRSKRALYSVLEWILAGLTDRVICTSIDEREHASRLGLSPARLSVVTNGSSVSAAPAREAIRKELGIDAGRVVIGFIGRMEDQKAPERAVQIARQLLPELPELMFLMIGDGPKRPALEEGMRGTGFADRIRWLGAVDARAYLAGMDVFLLPSLYEGFAYALLEALYAGLPIVSTPVGGVQECVMPGRNGFIVPHQPLDAMVLAIRRLATDGEIRRSMAEASREHSTNFSVALMADGIENLYGEVLDAKAANKTRSFARSRGFVRSLSAIGWRVAAGRPDLSAGVGGGREAEGGA